MEKKPNLGFFFSALIFSFYVRIILKGGTYGQNRRVIKEIQ